MKITDINLLTLSDETASSQPLRDDTAELVNRIVFEFGNDDTPEGDVIFVPGNPFFWEQRVRKAVGIWKQNPSAHIVLSGGAPNSPNGLTEAEQMAGYCTNHGVPADQIITEQQSTTTVENFLFSAPLIRALEIPSPRIIAVTSASHMRRVLMNFEKYRTLFPEGASMIPCRTTSPTDNPDCWFLDAEARKTVAMELKFIHAYLYEGGYHGFDIKNPESE